MTVENRYLATIQELLNRLNVSQMEVRLPEYHSTMRRMFKILPSTDRLSGIISFSRGCLRNKFWGELYHPEINIRFGYDYYLHITCSLPEEEISRIVSKHQLFYQAFTDKDLEEAEIVQSVSVHMYLATRDTELEISDDAMIEKLSLLSDINRKDCDGYPLLVTAAQHQRESIVSYLLTRNINIDATNWDGQSALHVTVQTDNVQIIKMLLANGADVNLKDNNGNTPLMLAQLNAKADLCALLTERG